uniref:Reverse transcriptase domain-containing protein n=1 Tax=Angiostrongylus cantonensis TaxID=6313 RepID=A0A0K0DMG5_ANGCA
MRTLEWDNMGVKIDGRQIHHLRFVMRTLEWDNMGVKIDGRQIHHLRFVDDIVLITPDISQAERMLADFDKACGKIGPCEHWNGIIWE